MAIDPPQPAQLNQSNQTGSFPAMFYNPMGNFYQQQPPPQGSMPFLKSEPMTDMAVTASTSSNSSRSTSPTPRHMLPAFSTLSMYGGPFNQAPVPNQLPTQMMPQMMPGFFPQNDFAQMMVAQQQMGVPFGAPMGLPFAPMFDTRPMALHSGPQSHSSSHQRSISLTSPLNTGFTGFDPVMPSPGISSHPFFSSISFHFIPLSISSHNSHQHLCSLFS